MSRGVPHIVGADCPQMTATAAAAIASGGQAEAVAALGDKVTIVVQFGDGSVYEYPNVPSAIAVSVLLDPEGNFANIKFWPGYRRVS